MNKWWISSSLLSIALLFSACSAGGEEVKEDTPKRVEDETHVVVDQLGRSVEVKQRVEDVVIGGILPQYSTWYVATNSTKEIKGLHPNAYNAAEHSILAKMSPDILQADSSFVHNGEVNIEEVMKLSPDVYFELASNEKAIEQAEEAGVPTIGIQAKAYKGDPIATFESWLQITGDVANTSSRAERFIQAQKETKALIEEKLQEVKEPKRAMMIYQLSEDEIAIAGGMSFGHHWLQMTGAENVAGNLKGRKAINMEQIYAWDPDIIYITNFTPTQPEDLYNNTYAGQDWSAVRAVKEGNVHKLPLGIYRSFPPNGDGPLMLKWLAQHNHPDIFSFDMKEEIRSYYKEFYAYELSDEEIHRILHPVSEAAKW